MVTPREPDLRSLPIDATDEDRMRALIDALSAYMELYHGGEMEMISFDGAVLKVRLSGNCQGCRLSAITLHGWVEGTVRPFFPNLQRVESVP